MDRLPFVTKCLADYFIFVFLLLPWLGMAKQPLFGCLTCIMLLQVVRKSWLYTNYTNRLASLFVLVVSFDQH